VRGQEESEAGEVDNYFPQLTWDVWLELTSTLENSSLFEKNPEYKKALLVAAVPERVIQFRVVWEDDKGQVWPSISAAR
jgi:hypothetical protein